MPYTRRADYNDMPLANKLGILMHELEIAVTDKEKADALAAVEHMKQTIAKLTPKPAPQQPGMPEGFRDINR